MTQTVAGTTNKERKDIISLRQFNEWFPDDAAAVDFVEKRRWGGDCPSCCPHCGFPSTYRVRSGKPMSHRCRDCKQYFSIKNGTVMAETKLPVRTWLLAMHLILTSRKGTSALQLHKLIGTTYKTAWFLEHRIREAMKQGNGGTAELSGIVEIDETYIGGKEKNKHASKKTHTATDNKFAVVGLKAHDGTVVAFPVSAAHMQTLQQAVFDHVERGSTVYSDGHPAYAVLSRYGYTHEWVNHNVGQYVNGLATTNGIESFWALLKRGYVGTFHYMSWKHLHRYVNEFATRHNAGPGNGISTIGGIIDMMVDKRLTYKVLTA